MIRRGQLYRVHRPGGDPRRSRVFVVVSRKVFIASRWSTVICAPVYSHGEGLNTQVEVGPEEGLKEKSWIMCDALMRIEKTLLTDFIGALGRARIAELNRALRVALEVA